MALAVLSRFPPCLHLHQFIRLRALLMSPPPLRLPLVLLRLLLLVGGLMSQAPLLLPVREPQHRTDVGQGEVACVVQVWVGRCGMDMPLSPTLPLLVRLPQALPLLLLTRAVAAAQ